MAVGGRATSSFRATPGDEIGTVVLANCGECLVAIAIARRWPAREERAIALRQDRNPEGYAVLLPGMGYPTRAPLASLLAGEISDRNLPAAWLTPPLTEPSMIDALSRVRSPTLLLGGTADAMWKADAIPDNPVLQVVELPDVDHALQVAGDPVASLDALRQMTEALTAWLQRIR